MRNLACAIISVQFDHLEYGKYDDEAKWKDTQAIALTRLLEISRYGIVVTYGGEIAQELIDLGFHSLKQKGHLDILWAGWFPSLSWRKCFTLSISPELPRLTSSSAWIEYSGGFILFAARVDDDLVSRFVHQKWNQSDQFVAIVTVRDQPYWVVVSNHLSQEELVDLLEGVFLYKNQQEDGTASLA